MQINPSFITIIVAFLLTIHPVLGQDQTVNGNISAGSPGTYWQGFRSNAPTGKWGFQQDDRAMIGMGGNVYNRGFSNYAMGIFNGSTTKEDVYLYNQNSPTGDFVVLKNTGNFGVGVIDPRSRLSVNGNIQITSSSIPMGLITELEGTTTPLLNLSMNFREPNVNTGYIGAGFRLDARPGMPMFQWLQRIGGTENYMMTLSKEGKLGVGTLFPTTQLEVNGDARIKQTIFINSNGQNSTEILMQKENLNSYYSIFSNLSGFGIYNSSTSKKAFNIDAQDNIQIGTTISKGDRLGVNGTIRAKEVKVDPEGWSDFVFEKSYKLRDLGELEGYIQVNKHLPEIPNAKEVEAEGVALGEMNKKLLQKIEELTLYLIEQNKKLEKLEKDLAVLKKL